MTQRMAVIDFETTGMSPAYGDRATEVAIVMTEEGQVVDRFQSLMNAGVPIPPFIESLTGISNAMLADAPTPAEAMRAAAEFVGDAPMVAHNASFDRRFWHGELALAGLNATQPFACTVLLSRRLFPEATSHKLSALAGWLHIERSGQAHRALSDAEVTAELLLRLQSALRERHGIANPDHDFLMRLQACSKAGLPKFIARCLASQCAEAKDTTTATHQ
ncbi:3'-5' exonuclease [Hydrogenophaga sp. 5NK40-0174]|uniref:3'-5' exonuclease n=1 Tax=Hydrogenophaga sp. 5NK40-0174 TaxID=3127649 RepID=UPI00333EE08A